MTAPWTADSIRVALDGAGFPVSAADLRVEKRDGTTVAHLPGDRMAWFADDDRGRRRLATEGRVLGLLARRCSFLVPRVLFAAADGSFEVRASVPGTCEPWMLYDRAMRDPGAAAVHGRQLGALLAEQHTRIARADVDSWLPEHPAWPERSAWIHERIPRVTDDRALASAVDEVLARYDAIEVDDADRVLLHGDVGFHNLAVDPATFAVRGLFDYEDASVWDRHHDLRYLLFDVEREDMLEAALAVYEPATGRKVDRARVRLHNTVSAACFLANRDGVAPETVWCGRTLAQDLGWTRMAIARTL